MAEGYDAHNYVIYDIHVEIIEERARFVCAYIRAVLICVQCAQHLPALTRARKCARRRALRAPGHLANFPAGNWCLLEKKSCAAN